MNASYLAQEDVSVALLIPFLLSAALILLLLIFDQTWQIPMPNLAGSYETD
jgi:hypothetical protein